jgi:hypothetical protein
MSRALADPRAIRDEMGWDLEGHVSQQETIDILSLFAARTGKFDGIWMDFDGKKDKKEDGMKFRGNSMMAVKIGRTFLRAGEIDSPKITWAMTLTRTPWSFATPLFSSLTFRTRRPRLICSIVWCGWECEKLGQCHKA